MGMGGIYHRGDGGSGEPLGLKITPTSAKSALVGDPDRQLAEECRPGRDWIVVGSGSIDVPGLYRLENPRLAPKTGANLGHPAFFSYSPHAKSFCLTEGSSLI